MPTVIKTLATPALLGLLFLLPLAIMEVVNRREYNEGFPYALFFGLWLNLFATALILLPVVRSWRSGEQNTAKAGPTPGNSLLTTPRSALVVSLLLILLIILLPLLDAAGWLNLDRLFNGPVPEQPYLPGLILSIALISIPVAAGMIAAAPVARNLRAGGSLFTYPIHLLIVLVLAFLFTASVAGLIVDQWPCFMGVPNCD